MREPWRRYFKDLAFLFLAPLVFLSAFLLVAVSTMSNPDVYLLRRFLEIRGPKPPPAKISLVLLTDDDLRPPLRLSPKYLPALADYTKLVSRIREGNPARILVDEASLPKDEAGQFSTFAAANGVELYSEELFPIVPKGVLDRALPHLRPTVGLNNLALVLDVGVVYRFPAYSSATSISSGPETGGAPAIINFFGPTKTITTLSFTDVLHSPALILREVFEGDTVLIALAASGFIRGQQDRLVVHPVPFVGSPMPSAEIHATMLANLADRTFLVAASPAVSLVLLVAAGLMSAAAAAIQWFPLAFTASLLVTGLIFVVAYQSVVSWLVWVPGLSLIVVLPLVTLGVFLFVAGRRFFDDYSATRDMSLIDR